MRSVAQGLALSSFAIFVGTGCVLPAYSWEPTDASQTDIATPPDPIAPGPAALQGNVILPRHGGGAPGSPGSDPGILRVWAAPNDASGDAGVRDGGACPLLTSWPRYHEDYAPVPDPAYYRFDDIPPGDYCVIVILDEPPFMSQGELPDCNDSRSEPMAITVQPPLTTAPPVTLLNPACR